MEVSLSAGVLLFIATFLGLINSLCFAQSTIHLGNETDRMALLAFKEKIINDPNRVLSSWNNSLHFCMWSGVTCSRRHSQRVQTLNITDQSLGGSLSPHIGNLSFLRNIDLSGNKLEGCIPQEIGHLSRLRNLSLFNNSFVGEIPNNLTHCSQLGVIKFGTNNLVGKIPMAIVSLSKLYLLSLRKNRLSGHVPPFLGNLSSLLYLDLVDNSLDGSIPHELGQLVKLHYLAIDHNKCSGKIPFTIYNLTLLRVLGVGENRLYGSLPPELGLFLPNLEELYVGENRFTGPLPVSLGNASDLVILSFGGNNFSGSMPMSIGWLKGLKFLWASYNQLVSENDEEFTFITSMTNCSLLEALYLSQNKFSGILPKSIANLSTQLSDMRLGGNEIFGAIPSGIENLAGLIYLGMEETLLGGTIPIHLMKLNNLQKVVLDDNKLSGKIPNPIGNLTQLYTLALDGNNLQGSIPRSLGQCQHLQYLYLSDNNLNGTIPKELLDIPSLLELDISMNNLTGFLPSDIGKLQNLFRLNISNNELSGEIPDTLGTSVHLEYLYMKGNLFHGSIPPSLGALRGLQELDLSCNNLTGHVPGDLAQLPFLEYLNLSFNNLEGEVPKQGIFQNASAVSILGNNKLCGGISELQLPQCPKKDFKKKPLSRKVIILVVVVAALFSFLLLCALVLWSKKPREKLLSTLSMGENFLRVTYAELFRATSGFSSANLIGAGSYGSVFRGIIDRMEMIVAIKVLKLQQQRASKSFIAECKALRSIKHRNIVKVFTVCSSIDFSGNDFKALVLEYMPNGSLDSWLHQSANELHPLKILNLIQRLNLAIDIACALDYLHNHCRPPIVHCDLKPSNILLDDDMVAHNIMPNDKLWPEYGTGANPSKYGDVYSYGILLLEMVTGVRPSDDMFKDDLGLHQFAKMALPESVMNIVDRRLLSEEIEVIGLNRNDSRVSSMMHECLVSMVNIGVSCSAESPKARKEIKDVIVELQKVRDFFLAPTVVRNV
ncbi:LRR.XII-like protein [Cinnamomum micranthum f. kanehirae]|uniref:non-specific serine/threonine protein kinase n=1 Tax=Cinnamomum micranthum f. kanehirae TaxID=337451 RepID=A0A3S3NFX5_9MAGN|nr:LRR.XII-like protein [Cinnamomum micranthum f. kanehirae]